MSRDFAPTGRKMLSPAAGMGGLAFPSSCSPCKEPEAPKDELQVKTGIVGKSEEQVEAKVDYFP